MSLATVNLKFGVNLDNFQRNINKMEKQLKKTGKNLERIGQRLTIGVTLPIAAIGAASLQAASDAEETESKFNTVFRNIQADAQKSMKILRNEYGLSSRASQQLLADTGDLLTGFGFSQEAALTMSEEVNKLAVDLASFTNFSGGAEGASKALTSALLGEREAAKSLGIAITENEVKKQMATNAAKGLTFESERMAKAQATLDLAFKQSANAIGDFARTQDQYANQLRIFRARLEDLTVSLGKKLLPIATKVINKINDLVQWLSSMDEETKKVVTVMAGFAAAIGPVLLGLGALAQILPSIGLALAALTGPIGAVVAATTLAVGIIISDWDRFKFAMKSTLLEIIDGSIKVVQVLDTLASAIPGFSSTTGGALLALQQHGEAVAASMVKDLAGKTKESVEDTGSAIQEMGNQALEAYNNMTKLANAPSPQINRTSDSGIDSQGGRFLNATSDQTVGSAINSIEQLPEKLASLNSVVQQNAHDLTDSFNQIINNGIVNGLASFGAGIGELMKGTASIGDVGNMLLDTIGGVLGELGRLAIGTGIAVEAIKTALKSLGGIGAIAAGVALLALSRAVSSRASSLAGGGGNGGGPLDNPTTVPARAMGGAVQMGQPYLVGERGPELFTPSGFGSITNARQTAAMGMMKEIKVVVEGMLSGRDIYLAGEEYVRVNGRTT